MESLRLLVVRVHTRKSSRPLHAIAATSLIHIRLFHNLKKFFDVFILVVVHEVVGHHISDDSSIHLSLDLKLSSVWVIPVGCFNIVFSYRLDLLFLNEYRVTVLARANVFVCKLNNPVKDVLFVPLDQRNVFVDEELRLLNGKELGLLQLSVLLPFHLLELVLFAELGEVDFKIVVRSINDLVVLVNSCLKCFASNTEPDSSENIVQAFRKVSHDPDDWNFENEHNGNDGKQDTEPYHVDLAHSILVKVLRVISHSFFINA